MSLPLRLAMWSGPRNISTAMMRAWENRGDCFVSDEPLYAHYLAATGSDHPGAADVIAHGNTDWRQVVAELTRSSPDDGSIWYQKHMTHHLLPDMDRTWVRSLTNVFLIRDPAEVVASYIQSRPSVSAEDIGLIQQAQLFEELAQHSGRPAPVIDAADFLKHPEAHLRALCGLLDIPFTERMLAWPAGPRDSDGIWAPHWYDAVWRSTGFAPWRAREPRLSGDAARAADEARPFYEQLHRHRLRI